MNVNFQTAEKGGKSATVEWYTPPEIIRALGFFDLDPCTSDTAIKVNSSAKSYYTKKDNGLIMPWHGRIWLNPPYSNPEIGEFMRKMANHNNGIALVFNRCDSAWFHKYVLECADSLLFLRKRIYFVREDGTPGDRPGCGSVLIAYGKENTNALLDSGISGKLVIPFQSNTGKTIIQHSLFD